MTKTKAFTLVELLVVMAIIAFLTVGSFVGLTYGLRQARDTQRRKIVESLNTALLAYYSDYQQYPGQDALPPAPNLGCTGSATVSGGFNYTYCSTAFQSAGGMLFTSGKNGLADYFDGTFSWGPIDPSTPNKFVGYWAGVSGTSTRAQRYGVCIALENINGGNVVRPTGSNFNAGKKDCICAGSDYTAYACKTLDALAQ